MAFNRDIHHRRSIRIRAHDYAAGGKYFVTICSYKRVHCFGAVADGEMYLNEEGRTVWQCFKEVPLHFPKVEVSELAVMPNHLHAILALPPMAWFQGKSLGGSREAALPDKARSLGTILGATKSAAAFHIRKLREFPGEPVWQRNYFEEYIKDAQAYETIKNYIRNNPKNWANDELFYPSPPTPVTR